MNESNKTIPANESEQSDMIDAGEALQLLAGGKSLKHKHRGALQRLRSKIFLEECQNLKQKDLCSLMGVGQPQLRAIESHFGLPVGSGRSLNMSTILKAFKKLLDDNKSQLLAGEKTEDDKLAKRKKEIEIAKAEEQIRKIQIANAKAEGSVVDREYIEEKLRRLATVMVNMGETFSRRNSMTGRDAKKMIDAAINSIKKEVESE